MGLYNAYNGRLALPYTVTQPFNYMTKQFKHWVAVQSNIWFNQKNEKKEGNENTI